MRPFGILHQDFAAGAFVELYGEHVIGSNVLTV